MKNEERYLRFLDELDKKLLNLQNRKSLVVAGAISGTSADGIDIVIAKFSGQPDDLQESTYAFSKTYPYSSEIKKKLTSFANLSIEEISQLHVQIGNEFADALMQAEKDSGITFELIGSHGQTVYHHSGKVPLKTTLQLGCGDTIAYKVGKPCIHNFRAKDIAAGGEGAPLTPATDFFLFRTKEERRAILNLGGIANITVFGDSLASTVGFDTGPANAPIDRLVRKFTNGKEQFDPDGNFARKGKVDYALVEKLLKADTFLKKSPPKSAGFENYGDEFVEGLIKKHGALNEDTIATATYFVVKSIVGSIGQFVTHPISELLIAGGGANNPVIVEWLAKELPQITVKKFSEIGVPGSAREGMAFGFLAYLFLHSYALDSEFNHRRQNKCSAWSIEYSLIFHVIDSVLYFIFIALYPLKRDFIRMGLGIKARATGKSSRWKKHLTISKEFYRDQLKNESGTLLIIGSGRLYDFPTDIFRNFNAVTLLDADPFSLWMNKLRFISQRKKLRYICADVSTWSLNTSTQFDAVISLNLLGQIPLYVRDAMDPRFLGSAEGQQHYEDTRKHLQMNHVSLLKKIGKKILMTFDREFYSYEPEVAEWEEEGALDADVEAVLLPHLSSTWLWHVSPSPDGAIHRVGAAEL